MTETDGKSKSRLGRQGEDIAASFLMENGYTILDRNYRALHAEIDIICEAQPAANAASGDIVFVEVKTRTSESHGDPIESITPGKLNHVKRAAGYYLYERGIEDRYCRFDVIGIYFAEGIPQIEHLLDVLDY